MPSLPASSPLEESLSLMVTTSGDFGVWRFRGVPSGRCPCFPWGVCPTNTDTDADTDRAYAQQQNGQAIGLATTNAVECEGLVHLNYYLA